MNLADLSPGYQMIYIISCILLSALNLFLMEKALYKVYRILFNRHTFSNKVEKFGFYLHGILAYAGGMTLVLSPLIFMDLKYGLMGTGFILLIRLLLKGKL